MLSAVLVLLVLFVLPACGAGYTLGRAALRGGVRRVLVSAGVPIVAMAVLIIVYWPIPESDTPAEGAKLKLLFVSLNAAPAVVAAIVAAISRWRPGLAAMVAWAAVGALVGWRTNAFQFVVGGICLAPGMIAWALLLAGVTRLRHRHQG